MIAPPWVTVPPTGYGGSEEVIDGLARGLVARGHAVRLFSVADSTCPVPTGYVYDHPATPMNAAMPEAVHVLSAYADLHAADVDVIHDHTTLGPVFLADRASARAATGRPGRHPAVVTTLHVALSAQARRLYGALPPAVALVCISRAQRASAPELPVSAVIHHGIDTELYSFGPGGGGYLLFVGRMSADKGPDRAIRVARAAGLPLVLIAKCREAEERAYLEAVVQPLLGSDVRLIPEIATTDRIALMQRAEALLLPITWPEPFGLVMTEALACGTPVLAFPAGAAPEIVDHESTGFLATNEAEMSTAATRIADLDRAACREAAVRRFSLARMAARYENLYHRLLVGERADDCERRSA
jgi:glycosyltransferase involved in cell wall biosynthesis